MDIIKARKLKKQILSEFRTFKDEPETNQGLYYQRGSDNPILFTIQVYALFKELGILNLADKLRLYAAIELIRRRKSGGIGGQDPVKGLYNRRPGADDRKDQWDNYEAISSSVMFGEEFKLYSEEIDDYGKKFWWPSYDNRSPYRFSIHSFWKPFPNFSYFECCRQGWHSFTYKAYASRYFGIFNFLWFAGKVLVENNDPQETSGKLISWLRYKAIGYKWYIKPFSWWFKKRMKKMYGKNWMIELIRIYHGEDSTIYKLAKCLEK
jgi:hypothetical protein